MSFFLEVVQSAFSPMVLFYMFAGVAAGICIGALPGLTATMGVALLLPLTFGMDATSGILTARDLCRRDLRRIHLRDPFTYTWYTGLRCNRD